MSRSSISLFLALSLFLLVSCEKEEKALSNYADICLCEGESTVIDIRNVSSEQIEWKIEDGDVCSIHKGILYAIKSGATSITATFNGERIKHNVIVISKNGGLVDMHDCIDMGLSIYWASFNAGAKSIDDIGRRFTSSDDFRHSYSENWRLPSQSEWDELLSSTKHYFVNNKDYYGAALLAKNGNVIFFPIDREENHTMYFVSDSNKKIHFQFSKISFTPSEDISYFRFVTKYRSTPID